MDDLTRSLIRDYVNAEVQRQLSELAGQPGPSTPGPAGPGVGGSPPDIHSLNHRITALETTLGITSTEATPA